MLISIKNFIDKMKKYIYRLYRFITNQEQKERNELMAKTINNTNYFSFNGKTIKAKVVDCYDGDTITCIFKHDDNYYKFKIRMLGYDSPEIKPMKTIPEKERNVIINKARDAKEYIEKLMLNKIVYLTCNKFDKYGRILATVKMNPSDKETINDQMIGLGYGYPYDGKTKLNYHDIIEYSDNKQI